MSMTVLGSARLETDPHLYFRTLVHLEQRHWWWCLMAAIETAWLDRILIGRRNGVALDLGCGAGATLERLARRSELQRVIGVEPVAEALIHAHFRRSASTSKNRIPYLVRGAGERLPVASQSVDFVMCLDVIQHLPIASRPALLLEISRVLRPGGHLVLRSNAPPLFRCRVSSVAREEQPIHPRELFKWCANAGLRVRRSSRANAVGSLYEELRALLKRGWRRSPTASGHPAGRGLVLDSNGDRTKSSRLAHAIAAWETTWVGRWGLPLPVGHSFWLHAEV
jgi:ubiquinone/menaquinone biosynthesis C-methylase UbiE